MKLRNLLAGAVAAAGMMISGTASAAVTTYASEALFQAALSQVTLINLDAAPYAALGASYNLDDVAPAAAFLAAGVDSVGLNAAVVSGQAYQISTPGRDRLILTGTRFGGDLVFNFSNLVTGVGGWSNNGDGGHIQAYSGLNGTGTLLGSAAYGPGSFGGLISTDQIRSVRYTCEYNFDLACGVYDVQFGATAAVPEAATWAFMILGFGLTGALLRKRRALAQIV